MAAEGLLSALTAALILAACTDEAPPLFQGYAEADYVRVAPAVAGNLKVLAVRRGDQVEKGELLFSLEQKNEQAARTEALQSLSRAEAQLEDLKKGKRPDEIAMIEAQRRQALASLKLSELELKRQQRLLASGTVSREQFDAAQATFERDRARIAELEAELRYARLGARSDEIAAAEAAVGMARAVLAQAEWRLAQKTVTAPVGGRVDDTLYEPGEWVNAGSPVVSLLPPENIKVRFFVPEPVLGQIRPGQMVTVNCDGCAETLSARVSFIASQAEYTPPVIYSRQSRTKLVYLIEAAPAPGQAADLHPGQPLDVSLAP